MSRLQLIPVLDLMCGQVVRGIAGNRASYLPVNSLLVEGSEPVTVAKAISSRFNLSEFYVADLDAIGMHRPHWDILKALVQSGFVLSVDAGVNQVSMVGKLLDAGVQRVILGLESLPDLSTVSEVLNTFEADRIVFSLDLKNGLPIGPAAGSRSAWDLTRQVIDCGLRSILVLDLSAVGMRQGIPTLSLCSQIHTEFPHIELWTGGGVRGQNDLTSAAQAGVSRILVASALHDGTLVAGQSETR